MEKALVTIRDGAVIVNCTGEELIYAYADLSKAFTQLALDAGIDGRKVKEMLVEAMETGWEAAMMRKQDNLAGIYCCN